MPVKPMRLCKKCKSPTRNANGFCDLHQSEERTIEVRYDKWRGTPASRGYDGEWRKCRNTFIREHPLCDMCQQEGKVVPAEHVHHIVPLEEGGARLDWENLQSLCKACHNMITANS